MIIDLTQVDEKGIEINKIVSFDEEYIKKTPINKLDNVEVSGRIYYSVTREIILDIIAKGYMELEDAITLEPIDYPFEIHIEEVVSESNDNFEQTSLNDTNLLDIMNVLWQNIVLEVPIRVVKDENRDISLSGEGWELIDENTKKVDPRLAPLAALLEKEGKE